MVYFTVMGLAAGAIRHSYGTGLIVNVPIAIVYVAALTIALWNRDRLVYRPTPRRSDQLPPQDLSGHPTRLAVGHITQLAGRTFTYSSRSATTGSTRVARSAGR